jgi:hypothetical protein
MTPLEAKYIACPKGSGEAKLLLKIHRDILAKDLSKDKHKNLA